MDDNYSKVISDILLNRSLPDFVKRDYPLFVSFLRAYLQYMEQEKESINITSYLKEYRDIDNTLDEFVEFFRREYMLYIPESVLVDKRLLAKNIKNFYANKGNEESYRFLFRILYGEDVDFYYPKVDILRASDGKWVEERTLKISYTDAEAFLHFANSRITGETSSATAIVENVVRFTERGIDMVELTLSDIRGEFQTGEDIIVLYTDNSGVSQTGSETILETYSGINMTIPGSGYTVGSLIPVRNAEGKLLTNVEILRVANGPITGFTIVEGGINYNGEFKEADILGVIPLTHIWNGKIFGEYTLDEIYDSVDTIGDLTLTTAIPLELLPGEGDIVLVYDAVGGVGSGAFGVVSLVDKDGSIKSVDLMEQGVDYSAPLVEIISITGSGGELDAIGGAGSIEKARLTSPPLVLQSDYDSNSPITIDFYLYGAGDADGILTTGNLTKYPGRWLNEDGHLSSIKKLQDNYYYQDYSYVIKVGQSLDKWSKIVKDIIHPAGQMMFGEYSSQIIIDIPTEIVESYTYISHIMDSPSANVGPEYIDSWIDILT